MKRVSSNARTRLHTPRESSGYNAFAWFYDRYWATAVAADFLRATTRLLLPHVDAGAHLLDICCGTGQLAAALCEQGFRVTGIDDSAEMLRRARRNAPAACFMRSDARDFRMSEQADGALALFDSFNHLLSAADLSAALGRAYAALAPGARFVFDLNTEVGYQDHLRDHHTMTRDDGVLALRGEYHADERLAVYNGTIFRLRSGTWRRADFRILERCHDTEQARRLVLAAGFSSVRIYDAARDLKLRDHTGRVFFVARKDRLKVKSAKLKNWSI